MEEIKGGTKPSMGFVFYIAGFLLLVPYILFTRTCSEINPCIFYSITFVLLFPFILFVLIFCFPILYLFYFLGSLPFVLVIVLFYYLCPYILRLFLKAPWLPNITIYCVFRFLSLFKPDVPGEVYLSLIVAYISLRYAIHWRIDEKFRWSRREFRMLKAVCEDISKAGDRVDERYHQLLNSGLAEEIIMPKLTDEQKEWVHRTKEVVENSQYLFAEKEPESLFAFSAGVQWLNKQLLYLRFKEVNSIWKNLSKQKNLSKLRDDSDNSDFVVNIYRELETSKAKLRSLEDLLIEDKSKSAIQKTLHGHMTSIKENAAPHISEDLKRKHQFKFELLEALLKDLEHAKLESAIERAWLEEMKAFLDDAEKALNTFKQRKERTGLYKLFNHIFSMADNFLRIDFQWMDDELTKLLATKRIYGFKLIIIQPRTDPYQKSVLDNHVHILSVVNNTRNHDTNGELKSLCDKLEQMHKSLKEIEGASDFKIKCSEQMKTMADELNKIVEKHTQTGEAWDNVLRETRSIDSQTNDIKKFIDACALVRRKSSSIIGLEEDTEKLVSKLTSDGEQCCFIVGMQGIGKTTLAKNIYQHKEIWNHFSADCRIWISVPNNDINALLKDVGNKITGNDERQEPEEVKGDEHYIQKIKDFLQEKKYLVVLDNVPTEEGCYKLKEAFLRSGNRSRILLTTRDMTVGSENERYALRLRTKEESRELFLEKAQLSPERLSQDETVKKAEKVVGRCSGLPLTLSRVGIRLAGETINDRLLEKASELAEQSKTLWSKNLEIFASNDHLKPLLPCITLFSKGSEIPVRRLVAIWVAEGLVQQESDDAKTVEDIAHDLLSELINLNIIQPLKKNVNGKVKTCCLPDHLHDGLTALTTSGTRYRVLSTSADNPQPDDTRRCVLSTSLDGQRLAVASHNNDCIDPPSELEDIPRNLLPNYKKFVSLISFDIREGDKPGNDIGNFLHRGIANRRFRKLKVLDLERVFRPRLPKIIGKLVELRYLGLRWTYLEEIPSTIGNLSNLETLDLKHTYIRILPSTIGKLQKLRRLYLNQTCRGKFVQQSKTKSLPNLQTLWGVFLDKDSPLKDRLDELQSLRKLELSFHLEPRQQEELANRIAKLTNLRSLRLRSVSVMSEPEDLKLGNFKPLRDLFSMYLLGRLKKASDFSNFPEGLSDLTLSASDLKDDPMPVLEKFSSLKSLCLFADSFQGERMACSKEGFPTLLVLKIWKLNNLKVWIIEEQAMQNLKELEIRSCQKLEVPDGLMHLQTLREVKLRDMQKEFIDGLVECTKLRRDPPSIQVTEKQKDSAVVMDDAVNRLHASFG